MAFTFVVNQENQTAEIITTNKFTTLLNQELIKQLTQIATAAIDEPQTVKDAVDKFKVYKIPLPPTIEMPSQSSNKMEECVNRERAFTPLRRMTPITRTSPRMSPATPGYAQLEPELSAKLPQQSTSPKRKRAITPHKLNFHQTIETTIDDSTKQKLISVLNKTGSEEQH
ncbi:hypothetical protein EDI_338130 [Entamoeba dispar SAW760]|uniref:Uncharacterized protein n=1 Tax=Entamoeba dispar (strain ATCC PRA-260 / SAW760) TaxID=370354 RepID=B0EA73_ENTDS|nr:uncharacterized protein EDI_338130 [Entamoeba dispar SAW760]EDR28560.1 hypothetical protein EDI_338130 [Entamoeba dispar SAW760]|eukprot:EDR28560.1 hypothetical protein EDI_338130 [Entamoeba dispar SAW760]